MVFTSLVYLFFLLIVFGATYSLPKSFRPLLLLICSYLFYMYWKPGYVLIIVGLTLVDYTLAPLIERTTGHVRKSMWILSLAANLGLLFTFKYLGFFAHEWNELMNWVGHGGRISVPDLILPIGISFHTFQAIAYTTDVYKGEQKAERNIIYFALFIAWFPQMVAGPIERAHSLLTQLKEFNLPAPMQVRAALFWLVWGLFKKTVIADNLGELLDPVFADPGHYSRWFTLISVYAYAFQIYCDFSGYTDMAKGSSLLFGVRLTENFERPYLSASFVEFWKRWHISLSSWFFEYVFYPLARRWPTKAGLYFSIIFVFLLSGFWHGANWTFGVWGLLNGLIYLGYVAWQRKYPIAQDGFYRWLAVAINFQLVCLCWIFFRSSSVENGLKMLSNIFLGNYGTIDDLADLSRNFKTAVMCSTGGLVFLLMHSFWWNELMQMVKVSWRGVAIYILVMLMAIGALGQISSDSFIYFQF